MKMLKRYVHRQISRILFAGFVVGAFFFSYASLSVAAEHQTITVKTIDEFIKAIGSDRTIRLETGTYLLAPQFRMSLSPVGATSAITQYAFWEKTYHALKLVIHDVENLTIQGIGDSPVQLFSSFQYEEVLTFQNARNLLLENLEVGHSPHLKGCLGGVLYFQKGQNIRLQDMIIFGSGGTGIIVSNVQDMQIRNSVIKDCSEQLVYIAQSMDVTFENVQFIDTVHKSAIQIARSERIIFENYTFPHDASCSFLNIDESRSIILENAHIKEGGEVIHADCSTGNPYQYPGITSDHIFSYERQHVTMYEFIEPTPSQLVYIHTTDFVDELYQIKDGDWSLLWQERIEPTGAEAFCGENEDCLQRSNNSYTTRTYYANYLPQTSFQFCINHSWEPFRGTNETVRCFDLTEPSSPILSLDTGAWIGSITPTKEGVLEVETYCKDCVEGFLSTCYEYDSTTHRFGNAPCIQTVRFENYLAKGEQDYGEGRFEQALAWFLKAYAIEPLDERSLINISKTYLALKNYDASIQYSMQTLTEIGPHLSFTGEDEIYRNLGTAYEHLGSYFDALYWYNLRTIGWRRPIEDSEKNRNLLHHILLNVNETQLPAWGTPQLGEQQFPSSGIAYTIPSFDLTIVISFVQHASQLFVVYKQSENLRIEALRCYSFNPESEQFELLDYNDDGFPDILKTDPPVSKNVGKRQEEKQCWLFDSIVQRFVPLEKQLIEYYAARKRAEHTKTLNLSQLSLSELPPGIEKFSNLALLDVRLNDLVTLSPHIGSLRALQTLHASSNQLGELPPEIGQLTNLQVLSLSLNPLQRLPVEIGNLENLRELHVSNAMLSEVPSEIGKLARLKTLDLHSNQLTALPLEIGNLSFLQKLDLRENQLEELPSSLGKLFRLRSLNVQNNALTSLPSEIGLLRSLRSLDLRNNRFQTLPEEIVNIRFLEQLDLAGNPFSAVEKEKIRALLPDVTITFE